jgi:endonuclease YncB( thermonuclease family)
VRNIFKQPAFQFVLVVGIILFYSLVTGSTFDATLNKIIGDLQTLENSEPSPAPVLSPTPSPTAEVKGATTETATTSAVVSEVVDGDTIRLSTGERVRYIGIDTPETVDPHKTVQCYGNEASTQNELLVLGKTVILEKDISETDRYGRLLRYVWLDGEMVNEKLVRDGYAIEKAYKPDIKYQEKFKVAQQEAQQNKRGLWRECPPPL